MDLLEKIGGWGLGAYKSLKGTLSFSFRVLARMMRPGTYNSAVRMVLVNQIYFTAVQILPLVLSVAVIFGVVFVGIVGQYFRELGLFDFFGHMLMDFVVSEFAPFITVLLIALRSGSAIDTEIAVMKVNREIYTLEAFGIDPMSYLFIPRVLNGIVSIVLLSSLFSMAVLFSGLFFSTMFFGMSFTDYTTLLVESARFSDLIVMLIKCATLGFFIVIIPIRFGLHATGELTSIPIAVLSGMVNVFIAIVMIEVLSLILESAIAKLL